MPIIRARMAAGFPYLPQTETALSTLDGTALVVGYQMAGVRRAQVFRHPYTCRRFFAKKSLRICAHSSASTPSITWARWLSRGSSQI